MNTALKSSQKPQNPPEAGSQPAQAQQPPTQPVLPTAGTTSLAPPPVALSPPVVAPSVPVSGRLEAITRGESIPTEVHAAMAREEAVVEIDHFNLFYGQKQSAARYLDEDSEESSHGANRTERLREIDVAAQRESAQRFARQRAHRRGYPAQRRFDLSHGR